MKAELKQFNVIATEDGGIKFKSEYHQSLFKQLLKNHANQDTYITVDFRKPKRSEQQNRFYRLYLEIIAQDTGDDPDDLHEAFKEEFLTIGKTFIFGKERTRIQSTTELSKQEFSDYLEKICRLTEVPIPDSTLFSNATLR